jgi:hypothetical protein
MRCWTEVLIEQPGIGRAESCAAVGFTARIILVAAEGRSNNALAKELKTSRPTVVDWRALYVEGGVKTLYEDRPRGKSFEAVIAF